MPPKKPNSDRQVHSLPESLPPPWTVKQLLTWTADYFSRAGLQTPRLDAEVLLAHVLKCDRLGLYLNYDEPVHADTRSAFRKVVQKRHNAMPVSYLTGTREFFSIPFYVSPSVLIPRPETELLIEYTLRFFAGAHRRRVFDPLLILDIGTGSGNIPVTLAKHLPQAKIVSVDISADALDVARQNLAVHTELAHRISLVRGDLLSWLRKQKALFHLIVSNPPYVSSNAYRSLPKDIREYEPRVALHAGVKGTEFHERILEEAFGFLHDDGVLLMEMGTDQQEQLCQAAVNLGGFSCARVFSDYAGKPRLLAAGKTTLPET
jgi:release factor glutamine methyltransferase